jgi:uncharacterized protein
VSLSEDRRTHFAHVITDGIWDDDMVDFSDDDFAMRLAGQAISQYCKQIEDLDDVVRNKVLSLKRGVIEGSPEWDTMYGKYFEEELKRRGNT